MDVSRSCFLFVIALLTTAGSTFAAASPITDTFIDFSKSEDNLQNQVDTGSEDSSLQQRIAALERAVGLLQVSNAELLGAVAELRSTTDEQRTSIAELTAFNMDLSVTNAELTRRIGDMEMSESERDIGIREECRSLCGLLKDSSATAVPCTPQIPITPAQAIGNPSSSNAIPTSPTTRVSSPAPTTISPEQRRTLSRDLYYAAQEGDVQKIYTLVAAGATFEYRGGAFGHAPLHEAAWQGHTGAVEALITLGAPINEPDSDGSTPLDEAAVEGREECVRVLLMAGADVSVRDINNSNVLHYAVLSGSPTIVKMLIAAGADTKAKDAWGRTPKDRAISDEVRALLSIIT